MNIKFITDIVGGKLNASNFRYPIGDPVNTKHVILLVSKTTLIDVKHLSRTLSTPGAGGGHRTSTLAT